jgi:phage terminase large subunit-like protein
MTNNELISDFLRASAKTSIMAASGLVPDQWQEQLITSTRPALVCCCRQAGKSTGAAALAAHTFYYSPGSTVLIVSPTETQSSELLRRAKGMLAAMPGGGGMMGNATTRIESSLGSRIIALPGTDASTRGYSPTLLLLDECAYLPDETIRAMMPSTSVTRARIVMLSTPAGRCGVFYELWAATEDQISRGEDPSWDLIRVTCETPEVRARQGQEFIEMERQTRSAFDFAQEYLAQFTASDTAVFHPDSINSAFTSDPPSVIIEGGIE